MAGNFKVEHIERAPAGWKIRTALSGAHRVRIAFPPGARRKGSGRAVEILHPRGENPSCDLNRSRAQGIAAKFPAELARGKGARIGKSNAKGTAKFWRDYFRKDAGLSPAQAKIAYGLHRKGSSPETAIHLAKQRANRRKKNAAELVIFNPCRRRNPQMHRLTESELRDVRDRADSDRAEQMAEELLERVRHGQDVYGRISGDTFHFQFTDENPKRKRGRKGKRDRQHYRRKLNPDEMQEAIALYEQFHGAAPEEILKIQETEAARSTYTGLGDLVQLLQKAPNGRTLELKFSNADAVLVASNAKGTQLYLIGGNQNLNGALEEFGADTSKDFVELGECLSIVYFTRKEFDGMQPIEYKHKFGEEGGAPPMLVYNKVQKRMIFAGGDYTIEAPGIIN
jgi:hypothetical protein